jgi:hypothetical protein
MSQSESINELASALSKAQGEMQAAIKDKMNTFYKSSYADLGSVWDAARPVLSKNGLCVMQTTELSATGHILMITTLAHVSGQWVKSCLPLNPTKNDNQGIGASITYLRRYSLSALIGVVWDDDDDGETSVGRGKTKNNRYHSQPENPPPAPENPPPPPAERISGCEIVSITSLLDQLDEDSKSGFFGWVKKEYNARSLNDLPRFCYDRCINSLSAKIKFLKSQQMETA